MNKPKKKMGRPTDSKKEYEIKARIDVRLYNSLIEYSEKNDINKAETIRLALKRLFNLG